MKIIAIAQNTFKEAVRNKIIYSVLFFQILLIFAATVFAKVTMGDTIKVIKDFGLFSLSFFGMILSIVNGVSLLSNEIKQKTIYNILSKPVSRTQFILGKFIGLFSINAFLISLTGLGFIVYVWLLSGELDTLLFLGLGYTLLEVLILSALTIFFSSIVITVTLTGIFTLASYLAGRSISYLNYFFQQEENKNPLVEFFLKICDFIVPDLSVLNVADKIVYGVNPGASHFANGLVYSASFSAVALILAILIFSKRELI